MVTRRREMPRSSLGMTKGGMTKGGMTKGGMTKGGMGVDRAGWSGEHEGERGMTKYG